MSAASPASTMIRARDALEKLPESARERSIALFEHGTLTAKLYAPRGSDPQTPHARDEIYVVIRGTGEFVCENEKTKFGPHDFLFVRAGVPHRFDNFSDDFAVWVFFYGPEGGERPIGD
jgi:mannose-6-phosphate isomerase-like protein (cupin superfamily)